MALALFFLLNLVVQIVEPRLMRIQMYDLQYSAVRVMDYERAARPDILFMGTSRVLNAFDPAQTEAEIGRRDHVDVRALNLGVAGGSIDTNYLILKNIISRDKQPSVIVYGLSEFELAALTSDDLAQRIDTPLLERLDDLRLYGGNTPEDKASFLLKRLLPLYRDHDLIRSALNIIYNPRDPAHSYYAERHDLPANGFVDHPMGSYASPAALASARQEYRYILGRFQVDPAALDRLHAFISLAQARGITVVLVNMPVEPEMRAFWRSEENIARYRALVRDVAEAHHLGLVDLYEDEHHYLPADGFFDYHHLNLTGARILTNLVTQLSLIDLFDPSGGRQREANPLLSSLQAPGFLAPGSTTTISALIASPSDQQGNDARKLRLDYRWLYTNGYEASASTGDTPPPAPVTPPQGTQQRVDFPVTAPSTAGSYILEVRLWFVDEREGSPGGTASVARQPVVIGASGPVFASDNLFRATLSDLQVPATMTRGGLVHGSITARNDSREAWPAAVQPGVRVSYHWLDLNGREVVHDGRRTSLPADLAPGQQVRLDFSIESPPMPGRYILVVDLVYEEVSWFDTHGNAPLRQAVTIDA